MQSLSSRTAIVHDWFQGYHGAERVVEAVTSGLFTDANPPDIYTFHAARAALPEKLSRQITRQARSANLVDRIRPLRDADAWRYLLPLMPIYFRYLDLDAYDLVLSSSHSFAIHARAAEGSLHVCYCHTPIRYGWMPDETGDKERGVAGTALRAARGPLRRLDRHAAKEADSLVANSTAVRERIDRFWGRDSIVIHPPVDVTDFSPTQAEGQDFLWVHRLVPHKRPEIVIEAFRGLPHRLTMVGVGMLERSLRRTLPPNVELLPWVSREDLVRRFERAAGFIHVGEEDFGISMVEALAAGTPVIALNRGGARDIVRPGIDGLLLESADVTMLREAVVAIVSESWEAEALANHAREFSRDRFVQRLRSHLSSLGVS